MNKQILKVLISEMNKSLLTDDVPVSAVIVKNNKIIAKSHNCREKYQNILKHAELIVLEKACKKLKTWHLDDCEIYITMEPCLMCKNAIIQSRIKKIYYILSNEKYKQTQYNMIDKLEIKKIDFYENEINEILKKFFKDKRK